MRVQLTTKASGLAAKGRPWFYGDDLQDVKGVKASIVRVTDHEGHNLGLGFYSGASRIRLRCCGIWEGDGVPDATTFFQRRLRASVAARQPLTEGVDNPGARLVHGDGDGLPGLVVDRYADSLVLQSTSSVVEASLGDIVAELVELTGARRVLARNDVAVRKFEGLKAEVSWLHGTAPERLWIQEHGVSHPIDLITGQKTGFFLDQRPARARVQQLTRELGAPRVLDLFCYQGAFALGALAAGASSALAIDQSKPALARAELAAAENNLKGLTTRSADVFDALRELRAEGLQFDIIVLDPPAFAKSRRELEGAQRGYRDLNRQAMRLLAPGGYLLTCSCSHHVDISMFEGLLRQGAGQLPFPILLRERLMAGFDHPTWLSLQESEYLKSFLLQRPRAHDEDRATSER